MTPKQIAKKYVGNEFVETKTLLEDLRTLAMEYLLLAQEVEKIGPYKEAYELAYTMVPVMKHSDDPVAGMKTIIATNKKYERFLIEHGGILSELTTKHGLK